MATTIKTFNSSGGFGINQTPLITETLDVKNVNTLELQNSNFADASSKKYILRGTSTAVLSINNSATPIPITSSTINFITAHIIGVNPTGTGHYSLKNETVISCGSSGTVSILSSLDTIIKDSIPTGEVWTAAPYSASANQFSYSVSRTGTAVAIKWFAYVEVVKVLWT